MTLKSVISIYIDNTGYFVDNEFGSLLKKRLSNLKIDAQCQIKTFNDLDHSIGEDLNFEENTHEAISGANIVIPIISSFYMDFLTPSIEEAINDVINAEDRYLFPVLLDEADWSNYEWIVKSQITPRDAMPLSLL